MFLGLLVLLISANYFLFGVFNLKMTFRPSIICMVVLYNKECYAII